MISLPHFIFTDQSHIDSIQINKGNFIICISDKSEFYVDIGSNRRIKLGGNVEPATETELGTVKVIENTSPSSLLSERTSVDMTTVPSVNTIKNWDGSYDSNTKQSNLEYFKLGKLGSAASLEQADVIADMSIVGRAITITYANGTTKTLAVTDPGCDCNVLGKLATVEDIQEMLALSVEDQIGPSGDPITSSAGCSIETANVSDISDVVSGNEIDSANNIIAYTSCQLYHNASTTEEVDNILV